MSELKIDGLVQRALSDNFSRNAASVIHATAEEARRTGRYPERSQLNFYGLTEANYLVLAGFVGAIPGGGANLLTADFVESQLRRQRTFRPSTRPAVLLGVHTNLVPDLKLFADYLNNPELKALGLHPNAIEGIREAKIEAACGLSGGSSKRLREVLLARSAYEVLKRIEGAVIVPHEGLVGRLRSECADPTTRDHPLAARCYELDDNRQISFYIHPTIDGSSQISLQEPNQDELRSSAQFNDYLRELMDDRRPIAGVVCLDSRQGYTLPHPSIRPLELRTVANQLTNTEPEMSWGSDRHTEFNLGVVLTGEEDCRTTTLAHFLLTNPEAIWASHGVWGGYLSHSRPAIIGVPAELLQGPVGQTLAEQSFGLLSNLKSTVYEQGTLFGRVKPFRSTIGFIRIGNELYEIDDLGFQLAYPETDGGRILKDALKAAHPMHTFGRRGVANPFSPNPPIKRYHSRTVKPVGKLISEYL